MNTTSTFSEYALISDPVDRGRVAQLEPLFLIVKSAKGTGTQGKVLAECAMRAGMTRKTFQNQYYNYIHFGVMGVADKRKVVKTRASSRAISSASRDRSALRGRPIGA